MVKNFDEELSGRIGIMLDAGSSASESDLDNAARLAGSLAYAALDEGHHVEMINLATLHPNLIPPFDDGQAMLDELAGLPLTPAGLSPQSLHLAVDKLSRKAALHIILTSQPAGIPEAIAELIGDGRKITLYQPHNLPALEPKVEPFTDAGLVTTT